MKNIFVWLKNLSLHLQEFEHLKHLARIGGRSESLLKTLHQDMAQEFDVYKLQAISYFGHLKAFSQNDC